MEGLDWLRWALEGLSKSPSCRSCIRFTITWRNTRLTKRSTCLRVHGVLEEPTISGTHDLNQLDGVQEIHNAEKEIEGMTLNSK